MNPLLNTAPDITAWLTLMGIENYVLTPSAQHGLVVNVQGSVNLNNKQLNCIPIQFNHVRGGFYCRYNRLTSLCGAPQVMEGSMDCSFNQLSSLAGAPIKVNGDFNCSSNCLASLRFGPLEVEGDFYCSRNMLTDLEFCPYGVKRNFVCRENQLNNLAFSPVQVGGCVFLMHNASLGQNQMISNFKNLYDLHLRESVKIEKEKLSAATQESMQNTKSKHKI